MPTITDEEFGTITLRRSVRASSIRIRVAPDGRLRASLPLYAPVFLVKRLVRSSRNELRQLISQQHSNTLFEDGMQIGKSHTIVVRRINTGKVSATRHGQQLIVSLPNDTDIRSASTQRTVRDSVIAALRIEAKSYLPKRLIFLADKHGFSYQKVRFSHAGGRWGSCSSNGTISLNIALMKLPFELIDYVLVHELSHTVEMNHSDRFWALVEKADPYYREHRRALKKESPHI